MPASLKSSVVAVLHRSEITVGDAAIELGSLTLIVKVGIPPVTDYWRQVGSITLMSHKNRRVIRLFCSTWLYGGG